MELGRILDSQKAVAVQREESRERVFAAPIADCSGDYILPVPLTPLQKELLDTVISAHYSELLGFLDSDNRTHKYGKDLVKMLCEIQQITTHPWLLLDEHRPSNLFTRDMPYRIGEISGKFEVLAKIVRTTNDLGLHVAILVGDSYLSDLVEAFLADKTANLFRYTNGKPLNHPPPDAQFVAKGSCYHIVPSRLEDLIASVNFAFDFMIVMDDTFELGSAYAQGIRAQLRDPSKRVPLAPLVRLIPLGSVNHVMPYTDVANLQREQLTLVLGSTVVLGETAGEIPPEMKYLYDNDLRDMVPWFQNADRPWPLARPSPPAQFKATDVEQKILAHEKNAGPEPKRIKLEDPVKTDGLSGQGDPSTLSSSLLRRVQLLVDQNERLKAESENLRKTASHRQEVLETVQNEMVELIEENTLLKRTRERDEKKLAKNRADIEGLRTQLETQHSELEAAKNSTEEGPESRLAAKTAEAIELREEVQRLRDKAEIHSRDLEYMRLQFQNASSAAADAEIERKKLSDEIVEMKELMSENALRMREITVEAEKVELQNKLAITQTELDNVKEMNRILSESQTNVTGRDRNRMNRSTVAAVAATPRSRSGTPLT
ncbi:HDA1 complex subunit 3 [Wickerhamiella sorbophila]|uniref:HDA1 complex subunit 3 n=1 Tax=Wickerhamiella sorbophila TaxID=45607 RepID=A0A2T0FEI2_9ASCO|nr:HDA1 complex subunit 3 [Wickerhamiella sorbophila]PRT53385.1 HDA1 complex subunit 3 [Wickerhamiella sorbophila]